MNIPDELILKQMEVGPMANFIYFIGDKASKEIAVIDPAWDVEYLIKEAEQNGYKITNIFLTHGHQDHVNGIDEMQASYDVPVYISKHEIDVFMPECRNLNKIENGAKLIVGSLNFDTILTPGHSKGCHCIKYKNILIAGDTIFIDGCGRCDLPGGDAKEMYQSLHKIIMKMPDDTVIFPGHNYGPTPYATLADQRKSNPYLQNSEESDFLRQRMGISF